MNDFESGHNQSPFPFRGGAGGGDSQRSAASEVPTPTTPLKGRGLRLSDTDKRLGVVPGQGRGKGWGLTAERFAELHRRAAQMRRNPTEPEKRLWRHLSNRQLGFKFRRQDVIGYYIADFACPSANLIVEVDGDTHSEVKDHIRDDKLAEFGFRVVRVTNADVMRNMEGVLTLIFEILREVAKPHPIPSPEGEGLTEAQKLLGISLEGSVG